MRRERKHYTPEEKVPVLRRHLIDKIPVSTLCEELQQVAQTSILRFAAFCRTGQRACPLRIRFAPSGRGAEEPDRS
jgi:hypothetical protein